MRFGKMGARGGFGSLGVLGKASGPALRQVANKTAIGGGTVASQNWMSRSFHYMRGNSPTIQLLYHGWYVDQSTFTETNVGVDVTITASIEYPAGTFTQVKFGGSTTGVIPNGGQLISDPVAAPPQGAKFYVRKYNSGAGGPGMGTQINNAYVAGGDALAAFGPDQTMSGTVTDGGFGVGVHSPQAILGAGSTISAAAIFGDSIAAGSAGTGTVTDTFDSTGDIGGIERSLGPNYPYINFAIPGQKLSDFLSKASKQLTFAKAYCDWMFSEFPGNDIFAGGVSAATAEGRLQQLWALWSNSNVIQSTSIPRTSSSDSFATLSGQTISAAPEAVRVSVNAWIRGLPTGVKRYFDVTSAIESSLNSGKWNVPSAGGGTASAVLTADGTHPNNAGHLLIQSSGVIPANALSSTAFATFDPANKASNSTLSNNNLTNTGAAVGSPQPLAMGTNRAPSGKKYFEVKVSSVNSTQGMGVAIAAFAPNTDDQSGAKAILGAGDGVIWGNGSALGLNSASAWAVNDVIGCAVDIGAQLIWFRKNAGTWNNSGTANPATGVGGISISYLGAGALLPFSDAYSAIHIANFGATAYANAVPSGFGNW